MKQTAVDWLFTKLWETPKDKFTWQSILKEAKEMEKMQIIEAYQYGWWDGDYDNANLKEQYYKETYENESNT